MIPIGSEMGGLGVRMLTPGTRLGRPFLVRRVCNWGDVFSPGMRPGRPIFVRRIHPWDFSPRVLGGRPRLPSALKNRPPTPGMPFGRPIPCAGYAVGGTFSRRVCTPGGRLLGLGPRLCSGHAGYLHAANFHTPPLIAYIPVAYRRSANWPLPTTLLQVRSMGDVFAPGTRPGRPIFARYLPWGTHTWRSPGRPFGGADFLAPGTRQVRNWGMFFAR